MPRKPGVRVLLVCGWKKSGKTTLIEEIVRELAGRGLRVLAVKRAGRALEVDAAGSDSARMFEAGADVLAYDKRQSFLRVRRTVSLAAFLAEAGRGYDIVLAEGHKQEAFPKLWLLREGEAGPPKEVKGVEAALAPGPGRREEALRIVQKLMTRARRRGTRRT
jgi:molybdopterin-guanine dinucleotide biosynthesis protein B